MTNISIGDALAAMSANENLTRRALALLATSVLKPPARTEDVGLWFQTNMTRAGMLSSAELVLFNLALAFWNGDDEASVSDLRRLDRRLRETVSPLIVEWLAA